jgi:hypothetical protein
LSSEGYGLRQTQAVVAASAGEKTLEVGG